MMAASGDRPRTLSKTRFQQGLQCEKRLWLDVYRRELATPPDAGLRARFAQGHRLGELARLCWPGHVLVREPAARHERAVAITSALLSDPSVPAVCEAAFAHDAMRVRVDVLARGGSGDRFDLIEVKSSARAKPEHTSDAAVQLYVLESSGVRVEHVGLLHVDPEYVWDGGEYDYRRLFRLTDLTAEARAAAGGVAVQLERFRHVLADPRAPAVGMGPHCRSPYICPFIAHCAGTACVRAPIDPAADSAPLTALLESFEYPISFVAPLIALPALPVIAGTRPYERIVVGWALCRMGVDGSVVRHHHVADELGACGAGMMAELAAVLPDRGSIAVFERHDANLLGRELPGGVVRERIWAFAEALEPAFRAGEPPPAAKARTASKAQRAALAGRSRADVRNAPVPLDVTSAFLEALDVKTKNVRRAHLYAGLEHAAVAQADALIDLYGDICEAAEQLGG